MPPPTGNQLCGASPPGIDSVGLGQVVRGSSRWGPGRPGVASFNLATVSQRVSHNSRTQSNSSEALEGRRDAKPAHFVALGGPLRRSSRGQSVPGPGYSRVWAPKGQWPPARPRHSNTTMNKMRKHAPSRYPTQPPTVISGDLPQGPDPSLGNPKSHTMGT